MTGRNRKLEDARTQFKFSEKSAGTCIDRFENDGR